MNGQKWDVALTRQGSGVRQTLKLSLPVALSEPMSKQGFNRAVVEIVPEGILVRPYEYTGEDEKGLQSLMVVDIPETWRTS